jgi:hypothetical protein
MYSFCLGHVRIIGVTSASFKSMGATLQSESEGVTSVLELTISSAIEAQGARWEMWAEVDQFGGRERQI